MNQLDGVYMLAEFRNYLLFHLYQLFSDFNMSRKCKRIGGLFKWNKLRLIDNRGLFFKILHFWQLLHVAWSIIFNATWSNCQKCNILKNSPRLSMSRNLFPLNNQELPWLAPKTEGNAFFQSITARTVSFLKFTKTCYFFNLWLRMWCWKPCQLLDF